MVLLNYYAFNIKPLLHFYYVITQLYGKVLPKRVVLNWYNFIHTILEAENLLVLIKAQLDKSSIGRKQTEPCPANRNSVGIHLKVCVVEQADGEGQRLLNNLGLMVSVSVDMAYSF